MNDSGSARPPLALVEDYLQKKVAGVLAIDGAPTGYLVIDPMRGRLGLRFPATRPTPDLTTYQNVEVEELDEHGTVWQQVSVVLGTNPAEGYSILMGMLDRVQQGGQPFAQAIEEVLASLQAILAERRGLSEEAQAGLFGELTMLKALIHTRGPAAAVGGWRGPLGEEHDFGIGLDDLEVKCTLAERRHHWISTPTQLLATEGRALYLLSVQLTAAASDAGSSLPELVAAVRGVAESARVHLDDRLTLANYRDYDADLYGTRYSLRTTPAFYHVHGNFPAITPAGIQHAVPEANRILELRYRIDLTGWPQAATPKGFGTISFTPGPP